MSKMNSRQPVFRALLILLFGLLWLLTVVDRVGVNAYGNGAPIGDACRTLYPNHGVDKQYGRSSYRVNVARRFNDSNLVVTLYSPTDTFLGFIMQARLHSDREMLVNGQFSNDQFTQALDCLGGYRNTLTHTNPFPKYKIESVWTPPKNFANEIVFRATVVQSKNSFWTTIDSDLIDLSGYSDFQNNNRINSFNIHNANSLQPVSSGFIVNKDLNSINRNHNNNNNNGQAPYPVASSVLNQPSSFLSLSHQPLVQSYPMINQESLFGNFYFFDYNACSRKLCFGLPNNCLRKRNCLILLTAIYLPYSDSTVEFEIMADHKLAFNNNKRLASFGLSSSSVMTTPAYYSMGISHDRLMGNDSVTDCVLPSDGRPQLLHSTNIGKSNEELADSEYHGVTTVNTTYSNGILHCKWRKRRRFTLRGTRFDLKDSRYYLMLAYGPLTSLSNFRRKDPHLDKIVSDTAIDFQMVGYVSAHSKMFLIKLHASFMVVAWVGFVSIGVITARYFKPLWLSHSMFGVRIWFAVHRSCMLASLIFLVIATISIYLYVDNFVFGTHQMLGMLAIVCAIINPIGAVFRPDCDSSKRWIFNWFHGLIGHLGNFCAIAAIFLAYQLTVIRLPPAYLWSIAFYLFFHLTVHSLLTLYFCDCGHTKDTSDITIGGSMPSTNTSQIIDSLADNSFLRYLFILYSTVILVFVITIISLILFN